MTYMTKVYIIINMYIIYVYLLSIISYLWSIFQHD